MSGLSLSLSESRTIHFVVTGHLSTVLLYAYFPEDYKTYKTSRFPRMKGGHQLFLKLRLKFGTAYYVMLVRDSTQIGSQKWDMNTGE